MVKLVYVGTFLECMQAYTLSFKGMCNAYVMQLMLYSAMQPSIQSRRYFDFLMTYNIFYIIYIYAQCLYIWRVIHTVCTVYVLCTCIYYLHNAVACLSHLFQEKSDEGIEYKITAWTYYILKSPIRSMCARAFVCTSL